MENCEGESAVEIIAVIVGWNRGIWVGQVVVEDVPRHCPRWRYTEVIGPALFVRGLDDEQAEPRELFHCELSAPPRQAGVAG
jgi:hypothetical protein